MTEISAGIFAKEQIPESEISSLLSFGGAKLSLFFSNTSIDSDGGVPRENSNEMSLCCWYFPSE